MPNLLNIDEFCKDLKSVTSIKLIDKKKFHPEGLFSEQIFGPLKNYTCQCGTYYGISKAGGVCEICEVDIVNSIERRKRFAKITLPIKVINPIFYDLFAEVGGNFVKDVVNDLMTNDKSILFKNKDDEFVIRSHSNIPENTQTWSGLEAIQILVENMAVKYSDEGIEGWEVIRDNIDQLFINNVIVLPPDLRPAARNVIRNNQVVDRINRFYISILTKKEIFNMGNLNIRTNKQMFYQHYRLLQNDINDLYTYILEKLSKKEGLIRGNILGKRIDFSGRAVITPNPMLNLDECTIPYFMFLELYKIQISKKLIEDGRYKQLNSAMDFVEQCIEKKSFVLYNLCMELKEGKLCFLNRQPSLHKLNMLAFKINISTDSVIKIHPLICKAYNADFDGDQMAVYIPINDESIEECKEKLLSTHNLHSPTNMTLTMLPNTDIILGIYMLTANKIQSLKNIVEFKGKKITSSQMKFNLCLPEDYQVIDYEVKEAELIKILNDIKNKYDIDTTSKVLDKIKVEGFKYVTIFGSTMSLESCEIKDATKFRNELYKGTIQEQLAKTSSEESKKFLRDNFKYSYMVESGARGSWDQVKQLVLTRGFISNFNGEILPEPIKNNLIDGLTREEFFNSTYGCRKGLLDVALNTGTSGYLSRKLIFTCSNLQIGKKEDCGTKDTLEVYVNDNKKAEMLIGRYHIKDNQLNQITENNYLDIVGKIIWLRSPIFCLNERICHKCYGDLHKVLNSRFIGILASQALGERNTQLVLRVFHTSGSAIIDSKKDSKDMKQMDIIGDLTAVSRVLHKFNKNSNCKDIVESLHNIYNRSGKIHHVHFECVVAQLMWYEEQKWRLCKDRNSLPVQFRSVQTVPSYESWLLGLAFSNPKRHLIRGILNSGSYKGVIDSILRGEKIQTY